MFSEFFINKVLFITVLWMEVIISSYWSLNWQSACSITAGKFDKCIHFVLIFITRNLIIDLTIRYVSLNIIEIIIIIPKPNIFTETLTQDSFRVCDLSSCNLVAETNSFVLCAVFLSCLVSELEKPSYRDSNPRHIFGAVIFVLVISFPKQTALVLAPFFCRA
jgi:hypothetical protein